MKRFLLLFAVVFGLLLSSNAFADNGKKDDMQRKSTLGEPPQFGPWQTSYPYPFIKSGDPIENPRTSPAVSTGYYWVDSYEKAVPEPWRPSAIIMDTTEDANNWHRILSGPNQRQSQYWIDHPEEGLRFFHNPADPTGDDSTDNAFAGPIPIGFKFVFNGIAYDSFYVSANGAVILGNTRYYYDLNGDRDVRSNSWGSDDCYNYMSGDWFKRGGRSGDGTSDVTADDWGFQTALYMAQNPTQRPDQVAANKGCPVIAPFYGDLWLSQWDDDNKVPRDRGKVFYHRDNNGYQLIIYIVEAQIKGSGIWYPPGYTFTVSNPDGLEPNDDTYLSSNVQIVLDRRDSSITFVYEKFRGRKESGLGFYPADELFRYNTACGVAGPARHLNYDSKQAVGDPNYTGTLPWAGEYTQTTYAWDKFRLQGVSLPKASQSIKFKQWKNTLRVCDISFRVRELEEDSPDFTREILTSQARDFEILAGHEQIGQLQPVAIVENLTNDIQGPNGVNFQPQDLNFRVKCAIINQATKRPLYNKFVKVDSLAIATKRGEAALEKIILSKVTFKGQDYEADTMNDEYYNASNELDPQFNGIPPYGFVEIFFPPFEPNELFLTHIGLMKAFVMIDPKDPKTGEGFKDMWPYDDTLNIRFWVMKQIPNGEAFVDDVHEFHVVENDVHAPVAIPSVFKWVSVGASVVNGENVSRHPLPPRGDFLCYNKEVYPSFKISSPCIKLHRPSYIPMGSWGGDEIRSFPIDMLDKEGAVLSLAVQRTTNRDDWERGWSDGNIAGVEHRVVVSNWYAVTQAPDELRVEFARPSPNWRTGEWIANIPKANWRYHPRRMGAKAETKMSAYTLFGGGGYMRGFLESDPDSALAPPKTSNPRAVNGLRYDYYDDGIDFQYQKLIIPIPDTFIRAANEGARYFRFRIQEYAKNNQVSPFGIPDDADEIYLDNIRILYAESEDVDIEMTSVSIDWPYTITPASQATAIPIRVQISNNTNYNAPTFWIKTIVVKKSDFENLYFPKPTWVWRGDPNDTTMIKMFAFKNQQARDSARQILGHDRLIYCRVKQIPMLRPGANEPITMPNWNARLSPPGEYVVISNVYVDKTGDLEPLNDTTFTNFKIRFGPVFAYDPVPNESNLNQANNDVERQTNEFGRGLTIRGYKMGGVNSYPMTWEVGDPGGTGGSGEIAMKFELIQEDTIFGYQAYFARKNSAPDHIAYQMFDGKNTPNNVIPNSLIETRRGVDDVEGKTGQWGRMVTVLLPQGIVLPKGTYWVAVSQLGEDGFELGASQSRVGMRCTNVYYSNPQLPDKNGSAGIYLNIEKTFREREKFGTLVNKNFFAYENGLGSGEWNQFMSTVGNPAYAHLIHTGIPDGMTRTYSRGTWMPLIRPYLKNRSYSTTYNYVEDCDVPVELTYFRGSVRQDAIDLIWETASEVNNYGFYVERRIVGDDANTWTTLPDFVKGNGTSNIPQEYNFVDSDVIPNTTYQYRLRQIDIDGTQSCDDFSNIVTLTYTENGVVVLEPNSPNPFNDATTLKFSIPERAHVTLDIIDLFGNNVKTLVDQDLSAGSHSFIWRAFDNNGVKIANGTYIYRLRVGEQILTGKMSLVK